MLMYYYTSTTLLSDLLRSTKWHLFRVFNASGWLGGIAHQAVKKSEVLFLNRVRNSQHEASASQGIRIPRWQCRILPVLLSGFNARSRGKYLTATTVVPIYAYWFTNRLAQRLLNSFAKKPKSFLKDFGCSDIRVINRLGDLFLGFTVTTLNPSTGSFAAPHSPKDWVAYLEERIGIVSEKMKCLSWLYPASLLASSAINSSEHCIWTVTTGS